MDVDLHVTGSGVYKVEDSDGVCFYEGTEEECLSYIRTEQEQLSNYMNSRKMQLAE